MNFLRIKRTLAIALTCLSLTTEQTLAEERNFRGCITDCQPRFGIVSAFSSEAGILLAQTTSKFKYNINGNIFTTGYLKGNRIVIVLTGVSIENASMLTQLMIDHFNIHHLLLSGIAGGLNPNYNIGDVVIPSKWSLPLEVYWSYNGQVPTPCGTPGNLSCLGMKLSSYTGNPNSDYQVTTPDGSVSTGLFMRETFVRNNTNYPNGEYKFDYDVDPEMLMIAKSIHPKLNKCASKKPNLCISTQPIIRIGGRGISISAFLANPDYRKYIYKTIKAVSVDMETAAFAHVAYANEIPFIAFRGLSDLAGGDSSSQVSAFLGSGLAQDNEAKVTLDFLEAWANKHKYNKNSSYELQEYKQQ